MARDPLQGIRRLGTGQVAAEDAGSKVLWEAFPSGLRRPTALL